MRRRSRKAELFAFVLLLSAVVGASPARAELSGAVDARPLWGIDGRYGGGLLVDLWGLRGIVRPGAAFGLSALSKGEGKVSSRFVTPLAFSLAIVPNPQGCSFFAVARLGGYLGAEKGGLIGGAFAGGSLGFALDIGEGANVRIAADAWGLIGERGGLFLGPSLGLGF